MDTLDAFHITGTLRMYEFPDDQALTEYEHWWPRFSLAEKAREGRLVAEAHNLVTSAGRTQILTFIGNNGTTAAFSQYYAVGTGSIYVVQPSDASLATEIFRAAPGSYSVVGNAVTVTTTFSSGQANALYTNAGLFGNGASGTAGSGTLMTHVIVTYNKTSGTLFNDYTLSLT